MGRGRQEGSRAAGPTRRLQQKPPESGRSSRARENVLATCLALAERGYVAGTGGNVALRADDKHFAVTPSATDYYSMAAADICIVR
ncbi:MAG: class II aldolase/adducin family protein, partial [Deltaproteobacteria bacterium]|nr:class II aldolase/adducin family protein [Deltaproteobacteria bacterium]